MQINSSGISTELLVSNQVSPDIYPNNREISLKKLLVVYTVLLGDKEPLGNPLINLPPGLSTDIDIDFICFTDNRSFKSDTWKFEYFDSTHLPADKLSRRPKALPHEYLSQYDISLYIDNIVTFKRLPNSHDLIASDAYLFRVFQHVDRETLVDEADAIAFLRYENIDVICTQLDFYTQLRPIDSITPVSACTVILRTHHHPKLVQFGITWWEQILYFSKRDQLSFNFTVLQTGCRIDYLDGNLIENDLIHCPLSRDNRRIHASFDSVRYAWINRYDPEARSNPKAHFLVNDLASNSDYMRRSAFFDYICHKTGSTLGNYVAPRRAVATTLNEILLPYRKLTGNILLVRIVDEESPLRFLEEELYPTVSALGMMLNNHSTSCINLKSDFSGLSFVSAESKYDVLVLLGLPPDCCYSFIEKCASILNHSSGMIIALLAGESDLAPIKAIQDLVCFRYAAKCKVSVSHSYHDDINGLIPNSLICFEWKAKRLLETVQPTVLYRHNNILVTEFMENGVLTRGLWLGPKFDTLLSAYVPNNPSMLVLSSTQHLMGALLLNPSPRHALMLGVDGAAMPRALKELFVDKIEIDLVDLNKDLFSVVHNFLGLDKPSEYQFYGYDSHYFIQHVEKKYEMIAINVQGRISTPDWLITDKFWNDISRLTTEDAVIALLVPLATVSHVQYIFKQHYRCSFLLRDKNAVFLGTRKLLLTDTEIKDNAAKLSASLALLNVNVDEIVTMLERI